MKLFKNKNQAKKKKETTCFNEDGSRKNITSENKLKRFDALAKKEQRRYLYLQQELKKQKENMLFNSRVNK